MMKPTINKVLEEYPDIEYIMIDIDENNETAIDYGVMSVPTFIVFNDGQQTARFSGGTTKKQFIEKLGL
jgi:thioredoxin 1